MFKQNVYFIYSTNSLHMYYFTHRNNERRKNMYHKVSYAIFIDHKGFLCFNKDMT